MSEKKEYIERGALIAAMHKQTEQYHLRVAMEFSAADVEPVARGEWKESFTTHDCQYAPNGVRYIFWYTCSNCGKKSRTKHARCLKCFAHMERSGSGE